MSTEEMRQLDAWIAENLFDYLKIASETNDSPLIAAFSDSNKSFVNFKTDKGYITLPHYIRQKLFTI